jgi:hypothetical protein
MVDLDQAAIRLRALWKSGRDKYASFFVVLGEVRVEVGDEALASWCIHNLRLGLDVMTTARKVLRAVDAAKVKSEFKEAKDAAAKQKRQAKEAERQARAEAARTRAAPAEPTAQLKAQHAKELAQLKARIAELERRGEGEAEARKARPKRTTPEGGVFNTNKPKPVFNSKTDRHSPGYMREYMREYMRRRRKAAKQK